MTALALTPNGSVLPTLSNIFDEWFGNENLNISNKNYPLTNLKEFDEYFEIELSVPGRVKKDFNIHLDQNILTISTVDQEENETVNANFRLRQFSGYSFTRSFKLSNDIDTTGISAKCMNGILTVHLPKKEEAKKQPPRKIDIK